MAATSRAAEPASSMAAAPFVANARLIAAAMASLEAVRAMPTALLAVIADYADSQIFVIGGETFSGAWANICCAYSFATGKWSHIPLLLRPGGSRTPPTAEQRRRAKKVPAVDEVAVWTCGAARIGDRVFVLEYNAVTLTTYSLATGISTTCGTRGALDHSWMMAATDDCVYVVGRGTEAYCPASGTWLPGLEPMPAPRLGACMAAWGDRSLFVFGGWERNDDKTETGLRYDIAANSWSAIALLPRRVAGGRAVPVPGRGIFVASGYHGHSGYSSRFVMIYNPEGDTWSTLRKSWPSNNLFGVHNIDGTAYYLGGHSHKEGVLATCWGVSDLLSGDDGETQSYTRLPPLPTPLRRIASVAW